MREVDQSYWKEYFDTHNDRRFEDLVNNFYASDAVFENPKVHAVGRKEIIDFLKTSNQDVHIELIPRTIVMNADVMATELDCILRPQKDLPDFLLGPVKTGDEVTMRMAAVYHMSKDQISQARIYWGQRVK